MSAWDDLRERLAAAARILDCSAVEATSDREKRRLRGKAEGVRLALSYMDDGDRMRPLPVRHSSTACADALALIDGGDDDTA